MSAVSSDIVGGDGIKPVTYLQRATMDSDDGHANVYIRARKAHLHHTFH